MTDTTSFTRGKVIVDRRDAIACRMLSQVAGTTIPYIEMGREIDIGDGELEVLPEAKAWSAGDA